MADCDRCGTEHRTPSGHLACGGHQKQARGGGPCRSRAGAGTDHVGYGNCKYHGGTSLGGRIQGANQAANDALRRILDNPEAPPVDDPLRELLALAGRFKHASVAIGERVNDLEDRIRYRGGEGGAEQLRAEVRVWERLLVHLGRVLTDIARLNIEDRLARIEQQKVDAVIRALDAALTDAGLADRSTEVKGHVARHLRAVAG